MTTKWQGLWRQDREGFYAGQVIKREDIPKHTRIILRYNKFYEKDGNRPRFVYCFADSTGYEDKCVPVEYENSPAQKITELAEIMREGNRNADVMRLPSDSMSAAASLYDRAIEIIEDLTGVTWDFSYLSY